MESLNENDRNDKIPVVGNFKKVSFAQFEKTLQDLGKNLTKEQAFSVWEKIKLPARSTSGSSGYDFYCPLDTLIPGDGSSVIIPTGICVEMLVPGWDLSIYPRSGLGFKHRLALDNSCGVIDGDYAYADNEGHIMVKLHKAEDRSPLVIRQNDRFVQGIFRPFGLAVGDSVTAARKGGMGSTGMK